MGAIRHCIEQELTSSFLQLRMSPNLLLIQPIL